MPSSLESRVEIAAMRKRLNKIEDRLSALESQPTITANAQRAEELQPSSPPVPPKKSPAERKRNAELGLFSIDDISTAGDRAIADHKADRKS